MEKLKDAIGITLFESKKFGGEKVCKGGGYVLPYEQIRFVLELSR